MGPTGARRCLGAAAAFALVGCLLAGSAYAVPLVAHYRLDDTGTAILDSSPNGLDGTRAVGNASTGNPGVTHVEGTAAAGFNSSNHTINLGSPAALDFAPTVDEFSISAWVRVATGDQGQGTIISKAASSGSTRQYQFLLAGGSGDPVGRVGAIIGGTDLYSTGHVNDNQPHHVAISVTTSGATLYIDGEKDGSGAIGSSTNPGQTVYIGARTDTGGFRMQNGWIDDLQVYSGALDPGQVKTLAHTPGLAADAGAVYREIFPRDSLPAQSVPAEGWKAHYGSNAASSTSPVIQDFDTAYNADRAPVNSAPGDTGVTMGYLNNYGGATTTEGYVYWTEEFTIAATSLLLMPDHLDLITFDTRHNSTGYSNRVVLRLDVDGTPDDTSDDEWIASTGDGVFTHSAGSGAWETHVLDIALAEWLELTFDPADTLELGTQAASLPNASITAFGIYQDVFTNHQNARYDNFTIIGQGVIPEPATLSLLGLGALALLRRRRRAR